MSDTRRPRRAGAIAVLAALALAGGAGPGAAEGDLEPYRAFARSDGAARVLALARAAMLDAARGTEAAAADSVPDWPGAPTGVYLTLHSGARTRACVGSAAPLRASLGETVRALAAEALAADRRRPPVRAGELDSLRIAIAFAGAPEAIADPMLVQPAREGLLVSSPRGQIAFIPGEARTVSWALREARRAGVIDGPASGASYARFDAVIVRER